MSLAEKRKVVAKKIGLSSVNQLYRILRCTDSQLRYETHRTHSILNLLSLLADIDTESVLELCIRIGSKENGKSISQYLTQLIEESPLTRSRLKTVFGFDMWYMGSNVRTSWILVYLLEYFIKKGYLDKLTTNNLSA